MIFCRFSRNVRARFLLVDELLHPFPNHECIEKREHHLYTEDLGVMSSFFDLDVNWLRV